jgi:hypothetical protein
MLNAHFTTSEGNFTVRLFDEEVPNTVANFVGLAQGTKEFTDPAGGQKTKRPFFERSRRRRGSTTSTASSAKWSRGWMSCRRSARPRRANRTTGR